MTDYITPERVRADRAEVQQRAPAPAGQRWVIRYDMPTGEMQGADLAPELSAQQRLDALFEILRDVFHQMVIGGAGAEALLLRVRQLEAQFSLPLVDEPGGFFPDGDRPAASEVQELLHEMYRRQAANGGAG